MRILILNWRDIKNPASGGAEILTHEMAKRWVTNGNTVLQISSTFPNCKSKEVIDGVTIIRTGFADARSLFFSVHFRAWWYYQTKLKGNIDVVIDEVHGIPFFTPWYIHEKKVVLVCEVAFDLWKLLFGNFFGIIGEYIERFYLSFPYHGLHFLTISNSTKNDLLSNGIEKSHITVLPMGLTTPLKVSIQLKEKHPTCIYVGRLSKSKGIEDIFYALPNVIQKIPNIRIWIVGRGDQEYTNSLQSLAASLHIEQHIQFWGFVEDKKKFELMSKAHCIIVPSRQEGWGLIVPEAGYVETPAIIYPVKGLKDIVIHGKTGIVCDGASPYFLGEGMIQLFKDTRRYSQMKKNAKDQSNTFSWDTTADVAMKILKNI